MSITLKSIAEITQVSVSTVSRVLSGASVRVSPEKRAEIERVAATKGYQPNRLARGLWRGRTDTIGLLISGLRNPFFVEILEIAEQFLSESGYQVLLEATPSVRGNYHTHSRLRGWPVDGALIWAYPNQSIADVLGEAAREVPVVYLGYERFDDPATSFVANDLYHGGELVAQHLLERGYAEQGSLAYVGPQRVGQGTFQRIRERDEGFRDYCAARGVTTQFIETPATESIEDLRADGLAIGEMLGKLPPSQRPRAVFCVNDLVAIGLYCGVQRAKLHVPDDIAIVGFDGLREGQYLEKPLTSVGLAVEELCRNAVNILIRQMRGENEPTQVCLPPKLLPGGTT